MAFGRFWRVIPPVIVLTMVLAGCNGPATAIGNYPRTAAAFQRAIQKGRRDTIDRGVVEQAVMSFVKIDPQTAVLMNLGTWPTSLSATRMQRVIDLMKDYGLLNTPLAADPMIFTPPSG